MSEEIDRLEKKYLEAFEACDAKKHDSAALYQVARQAMSRWYSKSQSENRVACSSHSGRRTAITRWSRKISSVGGSLRDVQSLARHSSLQMTQRYIEVSEDAMRKVVG